MTSIGKECVHPAGNPFAGLSQSVRDGRLTGFIPVQFHRNHRSAGRVHCRIIDHVRRHGYESLDATPKAEEWWVQEVIEHRGKTSFNQECTLGYYNFEGEFQRRQDGNYNGGFFQYCNHLKEVSARMDAHVAFTDKPLTSE
jgi:hypothetical protein